MFPATLGNTDSTNTTSACAESPALTGNWRLVRELPTMKGSAFLRM
jgi:hypothetical protein